MQRSGRQGEEGTAAHPEKQTESRTVRAVCQRNVNRQPEQTVAFKKGLSFDRSALLELYRRQSFTRLDICTPSTQVTAAFFLCCGHIPCDPSYSCPVKNSNLSYPLLFT